MRSRLRLSAGDPQGALAAIPAYIARIDAIAVPASNAAATFMKRNILDGNLGVAAAAAIRTGHYAQAEGFARRKLALPIDRTTEGDPEVSHNEARVLLAHAIALQGRFDEAHSTLQPALDHYRQQQAAGARETYFRRAFAYALYVDAIAQPADAAGRKQRKADLDEAAKQIAGASAEAQKLADLRYVSGLIAATARGE
jgi:hypothetical protein